MLYKIRDASISVGRSEQLTANGWGIKERKEAMKRNYRCDECGEYHVRVYDKKNDRLYRP